jgi:Xaa-Pro aminopeptidase
MAQVKTPQEIKYISEACRITDQIFSETLEFIKKKKKNKKTPSEIEVQHFILENIKQRKLRPSFPPIVTSGPRAGNDIHPLSTKNTLKGFVIIDLGVRVRGYCSDMTRTIYIGTPLDEDRDIYQKVLDAQLLGIKHARSNTRASDLDHTVRMFFGAYIQYFVHTLGHGLGRRIHEAPVIYEKRTKPILKEGMVITIEPGLYIKNRLGIRIEDTLLVTSSRAKVITKAPKQLICIT